MTTRRTPISRSAKGQITPAAVEAYRRLRSWDGQCTCPPTPPFPGQTFNSADPEHRERARRYYKTSAAYELECSKCPACPAQAVEREFLVRELKISPRPWLERLGDYPEIVRALEAAALGGMRLAPTRRSPFQAGRRRPPSP